MVSYELSDLGISASIGVTGFVLVIVIALVVFQVVQYLKIEYYKQAQLRLLGVLFAPLVLGVLSWIQMLSGPQEGLNFFLILYRCVFLISFTEYLLCILGWGDAQHPPYFKDDQKKIDRLVRLGTVKHNCPCCGKISVDSPEKAKKFLLRIRIMAYQSIPVFIITLIIGLILLFSSDYLEPGNYETDSSLFWLDLIRSISFGVSFYHILMLIKLFSGLKEYDKDYKYHILLPFFIILVSVPEPLIIGIFAENDAIADTDEYDTEDISVFTYSMLVVIEMLILGFLQLTLLPIKHLAKPPDEDKELEIR